MTDVRLEVASRAGGQCECRGGCGRKHKDGDGRCTRPDLPRAPLHAVPREPSPTRTAVTLPAAALHALCGPCHDGTEKNRAAERAAALREQAATEALF
jgi:hypothetical protein